MNWRLKSRIQNVVALLPPSFSYPTYYWIQRHVGGLRHINPIKGLRKFLGACDRIEKIGASAVGGVFLEVGTGRQINSPLGAWLLGARKIVTVDLNPYLRDELVREDIAYIRRHVGEISGILGSRIHDDRLDKLLHFTTGSWQLAELLDFCCIQYIAPGDAASLALPSNSCDFHMSFDVFEHIPEEGLRAILAEGNRLLKRSGLFVHRIDYSDHFSHTDKSISPINFLQFSADEWRRIAGNRYMYMNRLRVDDFIGLFREAGHEILLIESDEDPAVREILTLNKIRLDKQFSEKPEKVLAATGSWIVTGRHP